MKKRKKKKLICSLFQCLIIIKSATKRMDGSGTVTKVIFIAFQTHMCVHNTQKEELENA
jgi:hypothetical protein